MLKRTGWIFVFLILLGLFGLAATIDVGSALPITQSDLARRSGRYPEISFCSPMTVDCEA
jgi:hypothetical protein